jgi:hypothetical protein
MEIKFCKALLVALVLCSQALVVNACAADLKFENYKVDSIFAGPNHALDIADQSNDNWKTYRSNAIKRKVNFAGHYIVYTGGCGGGAICGEILDAKTGKIVSGFPNAYELESPDGSFYGAVFHLNSNLLVISGIAADPEKDQNGKVLPAQNRTRYYEFTDNELVLMKVD